jgi:membrane protein
MLKQTVRDFLDDDCPTMAAALAYYITFSLPALLFLILTVVGLVMDPRTVQERLLNEFGGLIGAQGAQQIETMVSSAEARASGGTFKVLLGIGALIFGATGAFMQLQKALNRAWEVKADPKQSGVKGFLMKRLLSFGLLLTVALLMMVALVVSAVLSAIGDYIGERLGGIPEVVLQGTELLISFAVLAALFAIIFRYLPDARISWRDTWVGATFTAVLFVVGKFAIGLYLGRSQPGTAFGAAGALAIILVWVYYSSMIVLLGAEFTQVWSARKGKGIRSENAVRPRPEDKTDVRRFV